MNKYLKDSICKTINREYLRRLLNKFFIERGYDNFNKCPNPVSIQDLPVSIPAINGIVELTYVIEDINLLNNVVKLNWNIFVCGNKRIFLGYTEHGNITDISNRNSLNSMEYNGPVSVKRLINDVVDMVSETDSIYNLHSKPEIQQNNMNTLIKGAIAPMPFRRVNP